MNTMKVTVQIADTNYLLNLKNAKSLAINLQFNGEQPNHFGAERASSETVRAGGFVGDTEQDGSCNVEILTLTPHCNGTHTETIGHIVNQPVFASALEAGSLYPSVLISLSPVVATESLDSYTPELESKNKVIDRALLEDKLKDYDNEELLGLVIRTLPNHIDKKSRDYNKDNYPPFITREGMEYLVERGVEHLLVDFPSVDRMYDDGEMTCHRIFWQIPKGSHELTIDSLSHKSISEMIFVPDQLKDGLYCLNLQIPALNTDAVPSRPVLIPIKKITPQK